MNTPIDLYQRMKTSFDYTPVIDTAVRELGVESRERAERDLDAFLQWFSIVPTIDDGESLQMIRSVDRVWHAFILNTRLYRDFCETFIGYFVDHDPLDVVDTKAPKERFADYTVKTLEASFGDRMNPELKRLYIEPKTCCSFKSPCSKRIHEITAAAA